MLTKTEKHLALNKENVSAMILTELRKPLIVMTSVELLNDKYLLSMLMNGQVRIGNAYREVERNLGRAVAIARIWEKTFLIISNKRFYHASNFLCQNINLKTKT